MNKAVLTFLFALIALTSTAQTFAVDTHRTDSMMRILQQKYDPYHLFKAEDAPRRSLIVKEMPRRRPTKQAVQVPVFYVPDPPPLFYEDEYRWLYDNDYTLGEALFEGIVNGVIDGIVNSKKKKKK